MKEDKINEVLIQGVDFYFDMLTRTSPENALIFTRSYVTDRLHALGCDAEEIRQLVNRLIIKIKYEMDE